MSYIVVTAGSQQGIIDAVNERIQDGWVPLGGVCVESLIFRDTKETNYHQAMTRAGDPPAHPPRSGT
jgi:hypothetical protein